MSLKNQRNLKLADQASPNRKIMYATNSYLQISVIEC